MKRKAIDSVLKNPKSFSISKSVFSEIQLILVSKLVHFLARKILVTLPGASTLGLRKPFMSTHIVYKFQLCTPSGFLVKGELINFQAKNCRCFVSQFTITWLASPKLVHMTLSLIPEVSKVVRNNSQVKVLLVTIKCSASRVESTEPLN